MGRFEDYLVNEASKGPKAAQWEEIITLAWNKKITGNGYNDKQLYKDSNIRGFKLFKYLPIGEKIADDMIKKGLPRKIMRHTGSGKAKTSALWKEFTGKGQDTPKTDMTLGNLRISLKKEGKSQLMSGMSGETIATFMAAINESKDTAWVDGIIRKIDDNFTKFLLYADADLSLYQKKHKMLTKDIGEMFSNDVIMKSHFLLEAMTGRVKFDNGPATATHIMVFSPNGHIKKFKRIDLSYISTLASGINLRVSFVGHFLKKWEKESDRKGSTVLRADVVEGDITTKFKKKIVDIGSKIKKLVKKSFGNVMDYLGLGLKDVKVEGDITF